MDRATVQIRDRVPADVPTLVRLLGEQQPASRYPYLWPLPYPARDFIVRPHELLAWTATIGDQPVGHLSLRTVEDSPSGFGVDELAQAWSQAHQRPASELAVLSAFFVARSARGARVGRRLHDAAIRWAEQHDYALCLDTVVPGSRALQMYHAAGWRTVAPFRPWFLPADAPDGVAMIYPRALDPEVAPG